MVSHDINFVCSNFPRFLRNAWVIFQISSCVVDDLICSVHLENPWIGSRQTPEQGGGGSACEFSLAGYIEGLNFGHPEEPKLKCISFSLIEVGIICYYTL